MGMFFSLLSTLTQSIEFLLTKKLSGDVNTFVITFFASLLTSILVFVGMFFVETSIPGEWEFWLLVVLLSALLGWGRWRFVKLFSTGEVGMITAFMAFVPLFTVVTGYFILGEQPSIWGAAGVCMIVIGAYVFKAIGKKGGFIEPFLLLLNDPSTRGVILIMLIWSFVNPYMKIGVAHADPFTFLFATEFIIALGMLPFIVRNHAHSLRTYSLQTWGGLLLIGLMKALSMLCMYIAFIYMFVAYVLAVKRLSVVFVIIFAFFLFNERNVMHKLVASVIMLGGVVLISL